MSHTIGSHSDDRGGTSDFPCDCKNQVGGNDMTTNSSKPSEGFTESPSAGLPDLLDDLFRRAGLPSKDEDETSAQLQSAILSAVRSVIEEAKPKPKKASDRSFTEVPITVHESKDGEINLSGGYDSRIERPFNDGWNDASQTYQSNLLEKLK